MPVALLPAALGLVSSGINAFSAAHNEKKDKQELAGLHTPFYKIQKEYGDIESGAEELAQGGLTVGSKDLYSDLASRGLGTAVSASSAAGGNPNDINRIFQSYNDSIRNLGSADSEAQIKNIQYYHQTAKDMAAQKNIQFGVNEYQPYQNKLKELTQRIAADKTNLHNSINSGIEDVQAGVTAGMNSKLFGDGNGGSDDPFSTSTHSGGSGVAPHSGSGLTFGHEDAAPSELSPELIQLIQNYMNRPQ